MINQQKLLLWLLIILKISTPSNIIHAEKDDVDPKKNNKALLIGIGSLLGGGAIGAIAMYFYNAPESNTPPDLTALQKKLQTKETEIKQKDQLINQKTEELQQKDIDNQKNYETFQKNSVKQQSKITALEERINDLKDPDKLGEKVTQLTNENTRLKQNLSKLQQQYNKAVEEKRSAVTQLQEKTKKLQKAFELIKAGQKENELLRKKLLENKLQQEVKVLRELEKTKDQKIKYLKSIVELYKSKLEEEKITNQELLKANQNLVKRLEKFEKLSIKINDINNDEDDEKHSSSEDELSRSPVNSKYIHINVNKNLPRRNWPKKENDVVVSSTNQYQQGGTAACMLIVAYFLDTYKQDKTASLYDEEKLTYICIQGASLHKSQEALEYKDVLIKKYKEKFSFKLIESKDLVHVEIKNEEPVLQAKILYKAKDVRDELEYGMSNNYDMAFLKNGNQTWGLLIHPDRTFSIFDSHTKIDRSILGAYIQHFSNSKKLLDYIFKYNFYEDQVKQEKQDELKRGIKYSLPSDFLMLNATCGLYWVE